MVNHEEYTRIKGTDGKEFIVYTNVDQLEKHMLELSPQDTEMIIDFTKTIRKLSGFGPPELSYRTAGFGHNFKYILSMRPYLYTLIKWKNVSIQDFSSRFKDPFLRKAFLEMFNLPDFPMIAAISTLSWMNDESAGYPKGGSLEFAQSTVYCQLERIYGRLVAHYQKSHITNRENTSWSSKFLYGWLVGSARGRTSISSNDSPGVNSNDL